MCVHNLFGFTCFVCVQVHLYLEYVKVSLYSLFDQVYLQYA